MSLTTDVIDPRARVRKLLDALGRTEDQVAASLRKLGVTGQRAEPCACPLFYYLRDALRKYGISVERVTRGFVFLVGDPKGIPHSDPVQDFLDAFDVDNAYPALVEPEAVNR